MNPLLLKLEMKGKGFSTCLMCESKKDLLMGSQLIINIIQTRFETDEVS